MTTQNPAQDVSDAAIAQFVREFASGYRFQSYAMKEAAEHIMARARELQQAQVVGEGVTVTVSGLTGSGKSAIAMEIEILCRALGLEVSWDDNGERNMTGGDSAAALALYKPRVTIIEQNIPRQKA